MRTYRIFACVLLISLLNACGFHLRGYHQPVAISPIHVKSTQQHPFMRYFVTYLKQQGLYLSQPDPMHTLTLSNIRLNQQTLASDNLNASHQVELQLELDLKSSLLAPASQSLQVVRNVMWQQNAMAASELQFQQIKTTLYQQASQQIINRIAAAQQRLQ